MDIEKIIARLDRFGGDRQEVCDAINCIRDLEAALRGVRADLLNEHGLNSQSIVCTVWHSGIETTVDFIDQALETTHDR